MVGTPDDLQLVAFERTQAPGLPEGVLFNQVESVAVNANGMLLFTSTLRGTGVTPESNRALFAGTADELHLLVREGDLVEVAPGDFREVLLFQFPSQAHYLEHQINDANEVLLTIRFTDLTDVIYRVTVPEPTMSFTLIASLIWFPRSRRRSRGVNLPLLADP